MGIVLLLILLGLCVYLLPFRAGADTRSYVPSAVAGALFAALLALFATGVLPWRFATAFLLP